MALQHEFDTVISRVKGITGDVNFIRWPKSDLISYINEGQEEYCKKTKILRSEGPLTARENSEIYTLPSDCFIVDRIEDGNSYELIKTTSRDLSRMFGNRFRLASGTPKYYYQDLDGQNQLRFHPNPSSDLRASFETIDAEYGAVISSDDDDAVAETYDSEYGAVVDTDEESDIGTDTFDYEEGAVTGVLSTASILRVFYVRYAREDILEIEDIQALQYYALHKCYEKDGPLQNLQSSAYYEGKFMERISEERGRVDSGQHANMSVRGSYA